MRALVAGGLMAVLVGVAVCASEGADKPAKKAKRPHLGSIRHVVLFQFKDDTSPEQVKKIEDAFRALPAKIPQIADFEWGTNHSPEGLADGFTHCFLVTFKDEKARDAYLPHAAHQAFVEVLKPHLKKVLVVDYTARD